MTVWLEVGGERLRVQLPETLGGAVECLVGDRLLMADIREVQPGMLSLVVEGRQFRCLLDRDAIVVNGLRFPFVVADPRSLRGRLGVAVGADGPRPVKATMPGRIVRVMAQVGDEVISQQPLLVIEAMKMQNELRSPKNGRVIRTTAAVGNTVQSGDVMMVIE